MFFIVVEAAIGFHLLIYGMKVAANNTVKVEIIIVWWFADFSHQSVRTPAALQFNDNN